MQELYERITKNADKIGITGKELGQMLGLKKSPLTDWKNGKSKPTLDQLIKMCEIFATSSDELVFGENKFSNTLTANEQELLELFHKLPEREQIKFIGRLEEIVNNLPDQHRELESSNSKIG